jgi:catechol 2,3-dioxygenase-like lactoylglutathione lyase family enzyme
MDYLISGIQQLGVGVRDVATAWSWYRRAFGMDVPVFQEEAEAPLMARYTGGAVQQRNAVLAVNLSGGSGFEIWQYTSRDPVPPAFEPGIGDTGILAGVMKCADVTAAYQALRDLGANVLGEPRRSPDDLLRFFVRDPYGNAFQIAPAVEWFGQPAVVGGLAGAIIGSSNIDEALPLYRDIVGYDAIVYDRTGVFEDLAVLPQGDRQVRRVLLTHTERRVGPFAELMGRSTIELIQPLRGPTRKVFADRYWGDLGFIHLCFDIRGMDALAAACAEIGHAFTVDSASTFDMGAAGGRFGYVEDPDSTLIEFVETHKVPVFKPLGIGLNLSKRPPTKPLPKWMIRMLGLARVR